MFCVSYLIYRAQITKTKKPPLVFFAFCRVEEKSMKQQNSGEDLVKKTTNCRPQCVIVSIRGDAYLSPFGQSQGSCFLSFPGLMQNKQNTPWTMSVQK